MQAGLNHVANPTEPMPCDPAATRSVSRQDSRSRNEMGVCYGRGRKVNNHRSSDYAGL